MRHYDWLMENYKSGGDRCLLWPFSCCTAGYGSFGLDYKVYMAHRYVCKLAHGEPPSRAHHAAHSCGNRKCINPKHLSWKTGSENQRDRPHQGRPFTGARKHLTPEQVREIRRLKGIRPSPALAQRFGCTESNIRHIQNRSTYRNVV